MTSTPFSPSFFSSPETLHSGQPDDNAAQPRYHAMPFGANILFPQTPTDVVSQEVPRPEVLFQLWAPTASQVNLILPEQNDGTLTMQRQANGWFRLHTDLAQAGTLYYFELPDGLRVPDPASRYQPFDVHGPSQVIDPTTYHWRDTQWRGRPWEETIIYELHVGTFTPEGTFKGIEAKLDELVALGITAIELMPLADFPGERNWGYDGVLLFAPDSRYGTVNDLKGLIDAAHRKGLMVFLDVVYNHFGPEGNYLHTYAQSFFDEGRHTPWGAAIRLDGSEEVRAFFIHNALYWLEEYHFDGLRLDAVHAIDDPSARPFLQELAERVLGAFPERPIHLMIENDHNEARWLRREDDTPEASGTYRAQWNDDFHHAAHVLLTGEIDGYYRDYMPSERAVQQPIEYLARCLTTGFAFQGEQSAYRGQRRGESTVGLFDTAFINFLQNHDQIGNRPLGERLNQLASPQAIKALWEVLLLAPGVPMLFMGEEWQATQSFLFFCDFNPDLASAVTEGRRQTFAELPTFQAPEALEQIPDPSAQETFLASRLDWNQRTLPAHQAWLSLCQRLLGIRQRDIIPHLPGMTIHTEKAQYRVINTKGLVVQWDLPDGQSLKLAANLGAEPLTLKGSLFDNRDFGRHDLLYQSEEAVAKLLKSGQMPPWSVIWLVG